MRGGSGEDLARTLTRRYPDFPVIFMPAYLARYRTAYLTGPILEKPFRANELCELIGSRPDSGSWTAIERVREPATGADER